MTTINKTAAQTLLDNLNPETREAVMNIARDEVVSQLTGKLATAPAKKNTAKKAVAKKAKEGQGKTAVRHVATDGRSASQFIRDCAADMSAKDVIAAGALVGLELKPALVSNVRKNAAIAAGKAPKAPKAPKAEKVVDPNAPKRGPGRPKGSTNKNKKTAVEEPAVAEVAAEAASTETAEVSKPAQEELIVSPETAEESVSA
jgi:hypothetical protein